MHSLTQALKTHGSIYDIPDEDACKLFWSFWDSGELVDDLFFFVSELLPGQQKALLQVCRHSHSQRPEINIKVDWNATLALNYICHSNFILRVSVCRYAECQSSSALNLVVDEEASLNVFASPIEDCKLKSTEGSASFEDCSISFPQIYFSVNNFDSCFQDIQLHPENVLIVELLTTKEVEVRSIKKTTKGAAYTKFASNDSQAIIFQGAISYDSVMTAAREKDSYGSILMNGPDECGEAQIRIHCKGEGKISVKLKRLLRSVISKSEASKPAHVFDCQLTFIRIHWLDILSKFHR